MVNTIIIQTYSLKQIIPKKLKLLDIKRDNKLVQLIITKKFVHKF